MNSPTRVLIVDDKKLVRDTVRDALYDFNCVISEAQDGKDALAKIEAFDPDVIFLDIQLQDMSGLDAVRAGKRRGIVHGKVIVLTAFHEPSFKAEAAELGVFAYLTKPIRWNEVRSTFAQAAPQSAPAAKPTKAPTAIRAPRSHLMTRRSPHVNNGRPRILVLDDKPAWLEVMDQLLGDDFNVTLTTSVEEALRHVRKSSYALVVLDMRLPASISGLDVLERMRRAKPELRAIVMTELPDYQSATESFRRGALDYVSKADTVRLRDIIHRVLAEPPEPVRVFLCYEKRDRARVSRLYRNLMGRGFLPWMDYKSILGGRWEPQIRKEIATTDFFVYCLSPNSLNKEGPMRKEIKQALDRQEEMLEETIFFITALLEDCEVRPPLDAFEFFKLFERDGFARLVRALSSKRRNKG